MFQNEFLPIVTYAIIGITVLISLLALSNQKTMDALIFYGPDVRRGQWYRFFSSGLIHLDFFHLLFNMYALYGFGSLVEYRFDSLFPGYGRLLYILMYVAALPVSDLASYRRHKDNYSYRSLGASGAVSAVIFAGIMLDPTMRIGFIFFPRPGIPGFIFGPLFLLISSYLDRRGGGNINHSAHFWGAVFGIVFILVAGQLAGGEVIDNFIYQVKHFADR
jgi:membrane associated rhomboid family serine protease